jgi:hypothetical protein
MKKHMSKKFEVSLIPSYEGKRAIQYEKFSQPSVKPSAKRDYTNSFACYSTPITDNWVSPWLSRLIMYGVEF